MRFAVLGPLEVDADGPIELDRPSHRRLLALLLLERGQPIDADALIDRFWAEDPPRTARAALQTHVSQVRRRLGSDALPSAGSRYRVALENHSTDLEEFERQASQARESEKAGALQEAVESADAALRLWRGAPFPDLADDPGAQPVIAGLEELRLQLEELRADARLAIGQTEHALPDLERIAAEHPFRERLWELLMRARTRLGRPTEALDAYRQLRDALGEIGLEPSPIVRDLEERIFREDPALVPPRVRHNLPAAVGSFVGRRVELDRLRTLLERHRLVTLTGVGGTGKTRLAMETGRETLDVHPDGVVVVDLAPVSDPELVVVELATALGLSATRRQTLEEVLDALRHARSLIVLDNCEHLLDACAGIIRRVLEAGPNVTILATSREAIGIPGEVVYAIPPLAVPPPDADHEATAQYDAVRLFLDRAAAADPSVSLDDHAREAVAAICRHLDGLPLAIELAAARVRSMPVDRLAERLEDRVRALSIGRRGAPPRHRTLEAVIAWSYDLLDPDERTVFEHLSVFSGGWTLEAATAVCASADVSDDEVEEIIGRLVDRSLVVRSAAGGRRLRMLETIRAFARLRLGDGAEPVERRHRDWYADLAAQAVGHLDASDQGAWLDRIGSERDNLLAALEWSRRNGDAHRIAALAEALAWYRAKVGHYAASVADAHLALEHLDPSRDPRRAAALRVRLAGTLFSAGDEADAVAQAEAACRLLDDDGPSAARVRARSELATLHLRIVQDDPTPAIATSEAAAQDARAVGDRFGESHALRTLGTALAAAGDVREGLEQLRQALAIAMEVDNPTAILGVYVRLYATLIDVAQDEDGAAAVADEALAWLEAGGDRWAGAASLYMWFAYGFIRRGDWDRAERMLDRSARFHLEGMMCMSYFSLRAMLRWMQGRLDDARAELDRLRATDPKPRYFRLLFPVAAEVAAEDGRLEEVRRLAIEHERADVIEAERATPAATLRALVRAEVDAATRADPAAREGHETAARHAMSRLQRLVERRPTQPLAGLQLDRPDVYRVSAEAELTRLASPDPDAWSAVRAASHFAYWRCYADWRRVEAELARDGTVDPAGLRDALANAEAIGADRIATRLRELARNIELSGRPAPATGR